MPDLQLPTIRLYYEERGAGAAILLIHDTSSSALVWGPAVEPLARLGRVIAYDRRGCTRSQRPEPYLVTSVAEHADDAAGLLENAAYPRYRPEEAAVAAIRRPVRVLVGEGGAPWAPRMAAWLAGLLGTDLITVPGGHAAYLDDPEQFAGAAAAPSPTDHMGQRGPEPARKAG